MSVDLDIVTFAGTDDLRSDLCTDKYIQLYDIHVWITIMVEYEKRGGRCVRGIFQLYKFQYQRQILPQSVRTRSEFKASHSRSLQILPIHKLTMLRRFITAY